LSYTLEFLRFAGFQEVFVYCCAGASQIKRFLMDEDWLAQDATMAVKVVTNDECRSLGDAMRDLDGKGVIRGDFALVWGDTVANLDLRPLLEEHRGRTQTDKNASMTLLYGHATATHPRRTAGDDVVLGTDAATGRILYHHRDSRSERRFDIPMVREGHAIIVIVAL